MLQPPPPPKKPLNLLNLPFIEHQLHWGAKPFQTQQIFSTSLLIRPSITPSSSPETWKLGEGAFLNYLDLIHNWDAKNARRITLIRKDVARSTSPAEKQELEALQHIANQRIRLLAPLPFQELDEFEQKLKARGIVIPD